MKSSLALSKYREPCSCSITTPKNIRNHRHSCSVHKCLRFGEAIYMRPGFLRFGPLRRLRHSNRSRKGLGYHISLFSEMTGR